MKQGAKAILAARLLLSALLMLVLPGVWASVTVTTTPAMTSPRISLAGQLNHFVDEDDELGFETISRPEFVREHFVRLPEFRSLGYDTHTHWFQVELDQTQRVPVRQALVIGSPELEELDVWVERKDGSFQYHALGYHRPYQQRPFGTRLFTLPIDSFPGMQLFFRVRTHNAIILHVELSSPDTFTGDETRSNFTQGLYFGILLIAALLYAILGARMRDQVMATYAGYVASQLLFHLGTTGYLPVLLFGSSVWAMDALPRMGWLGSAIFILLMWDQLLGLKESRPRVHYLYLFGIFLHLGLLPFALVPSLVSSATLLVVKLANHLNVLSFFIAMLLLAHAWYRSRRRVWLIYLVAFVIPALGALVNTATNQGFLPWNGVTGSFYQLTALVHVLVMSYGLALRLRQVQRDKTAAEQEAAILSQRAQEQRHFVAMLSHEFNNPLAAIDRAAQMIQFNMPELPPKEALRLGLIRNNAATLSGFVDHFLMTEALDKGALKLSRRPCQIQKLLDDTLLQQDLAALKRIRVSQCPGGSFEMDATLIGVAMGNLLTNALRYSPPDSPVELVISLDARGLRIRVADHGPGLGPDELEQLGRLYFRGTTALGKKGSGLGYHFTRRILEAHGSGTLTASSPADGGLVVEIYLPR